jgi:membrane protease YdiL (CAAX protease family)
MMSDKPWQADAVIELCLGLLISVSAGGLVGIGLRHYVPAMGPDALDFSNFIISNICFHGAALGLMVHFLRRHRVGWKAAFGFASGNRGQVVGLGLAAALVMLPVSWTLNLTSAWVMTRIHVEPVAQQSVQTLETTVSVAARIYFGVIAILIAPVVEELLFRGILYPAIKHRGHPRLALWGTSIFFALTHNNLMTFVPLTVLALALTLVYERTDNLASSMITHSLFNAANFFWLVNADTIFRFLNRFAHP